MEEIQYLSKKFNLFMVWVCALCATFLVICSIFLKIDLFLYVGMIIIVFEFYFAMSLNKKYETQ